jgi:hypothetical protein
MRTVLLAIILLGSVSTGASGAVQSSDIIGDWRDPCLDGQGWWEFHRDGRYEFGCGTAIDAGRWRLRGDKLELVSYDDYLRKTFSKRSLRETIVIEYFTRHAMRVRLPDRGRLTWRRKA